MATSAELCRKLTVITDESLPAARIETIVEAACRAGGLTVQLRARGWSGRALHALAERLRELTRRSECLFVVHERIDIAIAVGADGVHLPAAGMALRHARALLDARSGPRMTVGVSVHSLDEIRALDGAADTLHFGPVFPTPSKKSFGPAQGIAALHRAAEAVAATGARTRVVAVGGITVESAVRAVASGAEGVAVIRAVMSAVDPEVAVRSFADALRSART